MRYCVTKIGTYVLLTKLTVFIFLTFYFFSVHDLVYNLNIITMNLLNYENEI